MMGIVLSIERNRLHFCSKILNFTKELCGIDFDNEDIRKTSARSKML